MADYVAVYDGVIVNKLVAEADFISALEAQNPATSFFEDTVGDWAIGEPWDAANARPLRGPTTRAAQASDITLTAEQFWTRWRAAAALQSGEPEIQEWTRLQLQAVPTTSLPAAIRDTYIAQLAAATSFPRVDPIYGDVMTSLGALFGLTEAHVDDLWIGDVAVSIDRANCPIATPVLGEIDTLSQTLQATQAALDAALGRIDALETGS